MTILATPKSATDAHARFMSALTPEMRRQILMMVELLEQHSDHFLIFTARKSVCLADVLRRLGYWRGLGDFCSNRALDGDCSVFADRDVLVVEDLAASCRTLYGAVETARSAGARSVKCFALSVEGPRAAWQNALGVDFLSPYLDSNIDDSIRNARSIVDAFAAVPRPYNIDWPTHAYAECIASERAAAAGWRPLRGVDAQGPVSFEPTEALLRGLAAVLPVPLQEVLEASHLTKVRVYPVRDPHPRGTHAFAVPVVALGAMEGAAIRETLDELADMVGALPADALGLRESYRLLQFVLGDVLLALFGRSLDISPAASDEGAADFLFLGRARQWALGIQTDVQRWVEALDWPAPVDSQPIDLVRWDDLDAAAYEREAADAFLADFFLARYVESNEYRLRCELRAETKTSDRDRLAREIRNLVRPADGASFTAGELRERLLASCSGLCGLTEARELVSVFLDRAIDAGEVVPDIDVVDGVVSRHFRPGEIINFEQDMQAQVEAMLHCYARHTRTRTFSADLLQKLVVGYVKYLLARGRLIDESAGSPSRRDAGRLQRRYHLRGAVLDQVAADFVASQAIPEVAQILETAGVVDIGSDDGYVLPPAPLLTQLVGDPMEAISFGRVLADVMTMRDEPSGKRQVDEDHLARLVTLGDPLEQALALSADMIIASRGLRGVREHDRRAISGRPFVDGVNNGLAKASWVKEGRSESLVRAVKRRLPNDDDLYAGAAESVLSALSPRSGESDARQTVRRLGDWFACAHVWAACMAAAPHGPTNDKRTAALERALTNKAFLRLGGLKPKRRGAPAADRLHRRLASGALNWDEELELLIDPVGAELLDLAQALREEAYELSARALTAVVRTNAAGSCLLLRSEGSSCLALTEIAGTGMLLRPGNKHGEPLLGPFDRLLPLRPHFDLAGTGAQLVDVLGAAGVRAVLIEAMPRRFQVFADTTSQVALVPQGFVELVEMAGTGRHRDGELTVLVPAPSASKTSIAVRGSGTHESDEVLLGCAWQRWSYRPQLQQLPLGVEASAVVGPGDGTIGQAPIAASGDTYIIGGDAQFNTVVVPDMARLAAEFGQLRGALEGPRREEDLKLIEEGQQAAQAEDKSALRRWATSARPHLAKSAADLGLSAVQKLLGL